MGDLKKKVDIEQQLEGTKVDQPKSSCSIFAIVIFLITILLIIVGGLLYIKFHDYKVVLPRGGVNSNLDLKSKIEKQIEDQAADDNITITINEADINNAFASYPGFPLKDPKAKISEKGLTISGKYGLLNVEVLVVPKVDNGKINYDIKEIKAGGVVAPQKISDAVSGELESFISSRMPTSTKKIYIENVTLKTGIIQATGRKR